MPVQERLGLLWVWPTSGPEAFIEAFATKPCVPPEHVHAKPEDIIWLSSWYIRCWALLVPASAAL